MTKKFLKLFTIYGRGVHLGHATLGIIQTFVHNYGEEA